MGSHPSCGGGRYASRVIARNALFNLAGLGLPLIVAVVCIPPLVEALGPSRFGLLALVWAAVSYFGVFDLGLGRALTQRMSMAIGAGRPADVGPIAIAGLAVLAVLGVVSGVSMWVLAPAGVARLAVDSDATEAVAAARAIAPALPWVLVGSGLRGMLEAKGAFGWINVVRVVTGAAVFAAPLAVIRAGWNDLEAISWALAGVRAVGCLALLAAVPRLVPGALTAGRIERARVIELLRTGGWITVTNVVSPLLTYLDRFVIGAAVSTTAIAWYVTPQEIVSRLLILPAALTGVLFPRLSELYGRDGARGEGWRIERLSLGALFLVMLPVTLALAAAAPWILDRWVGPRFAAEGATAMVVLCGGVLLNALAQVPFSALQARDGARSTALLQLAELLPFIAVAWFATLHWGVTGTACAWTLRVLVDFAALRWLSRPADAGADRRGGDHAAAIVGLLVGGAFAVLAVGAPAWRIEAGLALGAIAWAGAALRLRGDWPIAVALMGLRRAAR